MILGLYKPIITEQGFFGGFWRVTEISLCIGDINNLQANCVIKCYRDYNFANTNPNGTLDVRILSTNTNPEQTNALFSQYFEGTADALEVHNSYYRFFKEQDIFFEDAIIIDTDAPETMQYLGENPNIIMPQNLQQGE